MRILLVANSYPSVHSPSGAPYISARVNELSKRAEVRAVALVPEHTTALRVVRRLARSYPDGLLRLHPSAREYAEAKVTWTLRDVVALRSGRAPEHLIDRAVRSALATVQSEPDVIHAHGMYSLPAGEVGRRLAKHFGVPFVVTLHGSDVSDVMPRFATTHAGTLGAADATIYVSESLRDRAISLGAPADRTWVLPNGVDPAVFHPEADERSAAPQMRPPRLLFVGNLLPVKGADRLPAILEEVRRDDPTATLDVVGSGPAASVLNGVPGIRLWGRLDQPEVAALMRAATVLVVPSREEGWGCVASEAYACGTPVVATAVGGLRESVLDTGLVDPEASDLAVAFAQAIARVGAARDPLRARVVTWQQVAEQELAILRHVVQRDSAGEMW